MRRHSSRDRGSVLPLVLILTVVLGALAVSIATYTVTALRTTAVTTTRVDRLADAEGGLRRALAVLQSTGACTPGSATGPNGTTVATTSCESQLLSGRSTSQNFGLVLTGMGLSSDQTAIRRYTPDSEPVNIGGEVFVSAGATGSANKVFADDGARVQRTDCTGYLPEAIPWLVVDRPVTCTTQRWQDVSPPPTGISVPTVAGIITEGACRVFQPGRYGSIVVSGNSSKNYFRSGVYLIDGGTFEMRGDIAAGFPPSGSSISPTDPNSACRDAQQTDIDDGGAGGAVFILGGDAAINFTNSLSSFEVYGYLSGERIYSVIAAPAGTPGLPANTRTPGGTRTNEIRPIINNPPTPNFRFLGEVWVPGSFVDLSNLSSWQAGRGFLGGITTSRFEFKQTGGAAGGLRIISLDVKVETVRHRITVTATDARGGTTTVSAVARRSQAEFVLDSWRVH